MMSDPLLAQTAAAVGDPARVHILLALMDRRARTAKELAYFARIAAPTASGHLAKLLDAGLIAVEPQGRNRYYRLASPLVAHMIEAMSAVAGAPSPAAPRLRPVDEALRTARTCYGHLAGRLGVAIADTLQARGCIVFADGGGELTESGERFLAAVGVDICPQAKRRRIFCRPCLDWTERRHHLAGAVGATLCAHCLAQGWVERVRDSRALTITSKGRIAFSELFALDATGASGVPAQAAA